MAVRFDLINRFNVDGYNTSLNGPLRFATVVEGGNTFVYATGLDGDSVNRYQMLADGSLVFTSALVNSASTSLNGPTSIVAAQAGGQHISMSTAHMMIPLRSSLLMPQVLSLWLKPSSTMRHWSLMALISR